MVKRILAGVLMLFLLLTCVCASAEEADWPYAVYQGRSDSPMIAITMDDCNYINIVEQTFRFCVEQQVYITFFPIGVNLKPEDADLWREIAESPWAEIGCHTQHHYSWEQCRQVTIGNELDEFCQTLDELLGYHYPVQQVRPPKGKYKTTREGGNSTTVRLITTAHGFPHVIMWNENSTDPKVVMRRIKQGAILLFHSYRADMKCVMDIVPKLKEKGYEPVTVSMLLGMDNPRVE